MFRSVVSGLAGGPKEAGHGEPESQQDLRPALRPLRVEVHRAVPEPESGLVRARQPGRVVPAHAQVGGELSGVGGNPTRAAV